jgi:hypothetical protein
MPKYQIYYARQPTFHPSGQLGTPLLTVSALAQSHIHLREIDADSLDDAFWQMQGENWSPHGEARALLQSLGLGHTSLSVGDVIGDEDGVYWECLDQGWRPLTDDAEGDPGHGHR